MLSKLNTFKTPHIYGSTLVYALICESYLAKSQLFQALPLSISIPLHYSLSTVILSSLIFTLWIHGSRERRHRARVDPVAAVSIVGLCVWLGVSSFQQDAVFVNLMAVLLLALLIFVALVVVPRLAGPYLPECLFAPICVCSKLAVIMSILLLMVSPATAFEGPQRFRGVFESVAVACGVFSIGTPVLLAEWLYQNKTPLQLVFTSAAFVMAVLTRSRGTILVCALFCVALILVNYLRNLQSRLVFICAMACLATLTGYFVMFSASADTDERLVEFFRMSDKEMGTARMPIWEAGLSRIQTHQWFGFGVLSRFTSKGDLGDALKKGESTYDLTMDPHNSLIEAGQAAGFPAAALLAIFMIRMTMISLKVGGNAIGARSPWIAVAGWSSFFYIVVSLISPSFLSFGSLPDRHFYLMAGAAMVMAAAKTKRQQEYVTVRSRVVAQGLKGEPRCADGSGLKGIRFSH